MALDTVNLEWTSPAAEDNLVSQAFSATRGEAIDVVFARKSGSSRTITGNTITVRFAASKTAGTSLEITASVSGTSFTASLSYAQTASLLADSWYFQAWDETNHELLSFGWMALGENSDLVNSGGVPLIDLYVPLGRTITINGTTQSLADNRTWTLSSGDVAGPASATDNAVVRFDATTGKLIQNSAVLMDDTGRMVFPSGSGTDATGGELFCAGGTGQDATGGYVETQGGSGAQASGGTVRTHGGTAPSASGGNLYAYGGTLPGGDIDTHDGGGSINTRGTGSMQFGVSGTRTTVNGSATTNRTQTLPDASGFVVIDTATQTLTNKTLTIVAANYGTQTDNGNSGASKTIDWTAKNYQKLTLTAACTLTFTAPSGYAPLTLELIADGTGNWAVTWPTITWLQADGATTTPPSTLTANQKMLVTLHYNGSKYRAQYTPAFTDA